MNVEDVFISIIDEALAEDLFTATIDFNIELALFSLPHILEDPHLDAIIQKVNHVLSQHSIRKALHGPVVDLYYDSRDSKVRKIAWERILKGLSIAEELGAEIMVVHSTFNPLFRASKKYPEAWVARSITFWNEMAQIAEEKKITVVLENIFDEEPTLIKEVIRGVNSSYFKACIDTGHINIFSKVSSEKWVSVLGNDLAYLHIHNNSGIIDEHNGVQNGTFDFPLFFRAVKDNRLNPICTLELRRIEDIEPSKKILAKLL
ncbi:sugar phosphate isomerase/epimerase family protein [Candidatus Omnitrophota bacterium]